MPEPRIEPLIDSRRRWVRDPHWWRQFIARRKRSRFGWVPSERIEPLFNPPVLGCLTIDVETYRTHQRHHEIADRVMHAHGHNPNDVVEIRLTDTCIEVDWIFRRDGRIEMQNDGPVIRTTRYEAPSR